MRRVARLLFAWTRGQLSLVIVLALGIAAIATVSLIERAADASRRAEVEVVDLQTSLAQVEYGAWNADPANGDSPWLARNQIVSGEETINRMLDQLRRDAPLAVLDRIPGALQTEYATVRQIYQDGVADRYARASATLGPAEFASAYAVAALLSRARDRYAVSADHARTLAMWGSAITILLLLTAFVLIHRLTARARKIAERLAAQNATLAKSNREDAVTDALTGLRNRRALIDDLEAAIGQASAERPALLALFDLDGFKQYNDTFGHAAGDHLLTRLSAALAEACGDRATAYRMGGDEFCVLARDLPDDGEELVGAASAALSESAEHWKVGSSVGVVRVPADAASASAALGLADSRMYAFKGRRASAGRQTADALLRVLSERAPNLGTHNDNVASLARATGHALGLDEHQIREIAVAAELHDIGKTAVPDAILNKPGPLDTKEWEWMCRHTLIGERIMLAAPALAGAARLVRSSHERVDGTGYPDGLRSAEIPLGARIIFVCDAFDAMTSERPYSQAMTTAEALAELRRCAGRQFDPVVVEAFCAELERPPIERAA